MKKLSQAFAICALILPNLLIGCGGGTSGGGSSGGGSGGTPPPIPLAIATPSIPLGVAGAPYSIQLTANNGAGALTWTAVSNTSSIMPVGLTLSTGGLLSGVPAASTCGPALTVTVTDSSIPAQSASATFHPNIAGFSVLLRSAQVKVFYNDVIEFDCSTSPVSWSLVSGALPPGLQLQPFPGVTTQLNFPGIPAVAGNYDFAVRATDASNRTAQQVASITVLPPVLTITDTYMQLATVNQPFDHLLTTNGGTPPYGFTVSSGAIPPGLQVNASTGEVSGTPTTAGVYQFSIRAADSTTPSAFTVTKTYLLVVVATALPKRNDSIANATPLFAGTYVVSLSPYTNAAGNAAPDQDFYSLTVNGGDIYEIGVTASSNESLSPSIKNMPMISSIDPVVEILDGTGTRLTSCNDPIAGAAPPGAPYKKGSKTFSDACVDHGGNGDTGESYLDVQIGPGSNQKIYVHIFDFLGRARPDFVYTLVITKKN